MTRHRHTPNNDNSLQSNNTSQQWHIVTTYGAHTHTHTHSFNGHFSGTTHVSRYQKGKTNLDFTEARDRQWVAMASAGLYASLHLAPDRWPRQHPTTQFFTGRMPFPSPNQQRQSTEGILMAAVVNKRAILKCFEPNLFKWKRDGGEYIYFSTLSSPLSQCN